MSPVSPNQSVHSYRNQELDQVQYRRLECTNQMALVGSFLGETEITAKFKANRMQSKEKNQ